MDKGPVVCQHCFRGAFREDTEVVVRELDGLSFETAIPCWRCDQCGYAELEGSALRRFEGLMAIELAACGAQSGTAFKFMRKVSRLRASDLADLLNVDNATISRWETGKVAVDRAAIATLGAILREHLSDKTDTLRHLFALKQPNMPPLRRKIMLTGNRV